MPHQIQCPSCTRIGLVRVEHVIKAASATRAFYCGACEYTWSIADQPEPIAPSQRLPLPKPRTRSYGPKRRD